MAKRLLDRQVELLDYLTSVGAIFGDTADARVGDALHGIDPGLLRLEARFSHEKRMEKILTAFPRTFALLGGRSKPIVRDFVRACPPIDVTRIVNARQFHEFVSERWRREPPDPEYLADVAACEFGCAQVRLAREEAEPAQDEETPAQGGIRRSPDVVLLRCRYDVRPIFEQEAAARVVPVERDTPLALAMPPEADEPRIFEVPAPVFDLLAALDDWVDPDTLDATGELEELIRDLADHGLVEVRA
jgi:hypothetical protein